MSGQWTSDTTDPEASDAPLRVPALPGVAMWDRGALKQAQQLEDVAAKIRAVSLEALPADFAALCSQASSHYAHHHPADFAQAVLNRVCRGETLAATIEWLKAFPQESDRAAAALQVLATLE